MEYEMDYINSAFMLTMVPLVTFMEGLIGEMAAVMIALIIVGSSFLAFIYMFVWRVLGPVVDAIMRPSHILDNYPIVEKHLTVKPKNLNNMTSMTTGRVIYNTLTGMFFYVSEEWDGQRKCTRLGWNSHPVCRVIDQNNRRSSAFSWTSLFSWVGEDIHNCHVVPVTIYRDVTFFGKHIWYYTELDFINSYNLSLERDRKIIIK